MAFKAYSMKKLLSMVAVLISGVGLGVACGDDSAADSRPTSSFAGNTPCGERRSECVNEQEGRTCPGDPGSTWVNFPCGADQQCSHGECIESNAPCTIGITRCKALSAVEACLSDDDEPAWQEFPCRADQLCQQGVCVAAALVSDAGDGG